MASSIVRPCVGALAASTRRAATTIPTSARLSKQSISRDAVRLAAFHASSRRNLLPPGPQVIKGTVNDPSPVPDPHSTHGSYHWTFERVVAAGLIPLSVAPFASGSLNPGTDAVLCALLLVHSHIGFQSVILDYVPKYRFPRSHKAFQLGLSAATVLVGIGLYEYETNDVGITETVKRLWKA